jgi:phage N-6-adenine-methyltransferase
LSKPKTTKSESLRDVDSSIPAPTLDELTESFKEEAKLLSEADLNRLGKRLFNRWLGQAERVWIAKHVHGVEVTAFAKMVKLNRAIAFDLVLLWKNHAEITAVAENEGRWYYWRDMVAAWGGRKRQERDTIKDQSQRIEELTEEVNKLRKQKFEGRGRGGHRGSENRPTPQYLYDYLHAIHNFDWDCCASAKNTKVPGRFYSVLNDALKQEWRFRCGYCNPPYHMQAMRDFLAKAIVELCAGHCQKVVFLLPAWTDAAAWFHAHAAHGHIEFVRGRIPYMNGDSGEMMDDAKFGVIVVTMTKDSLLDGDKLSASRLVIPKPKKAGKRIAAPTPEKHPTDIESPSLTVTLL